MINDDHQRSKLILTILEKKCKKIDPLEEEKRILEERKKLKEAGLIGSTMDALDGAASVVGSGVGLVGTGLGIGVGLVRSGVTAGAGLVGTGVNSGVRMVRSGFGAVGSGLSKAGKFMGRTITGQSSHSRKISGSTTPVSSVQENGGAKPR